MLITENFIDYEKYKTIQANLISSFTNQVNNKYYHYSQFWNRVFAHRDNVKELSDFLISLNDKFKFTDGIADIRPNINMANFIRYYQTFLNKEILQKYPMSWLGAPSIVDFEGCPASAAYLSNLRLFTEVESMLTNNTAINKPLHIVEIGAGYGGLAYFLLKSGRAASYTIIDLPENLQISAFFLTQIFQEMPYTVLSSPKTVQQSVKGLNFVAAGNIDSISKWNFDLAINSDSLGEMPIQTAQAYVIWIYEHLVEAGYFFTKNGHNRGPDCIQYPHQYGYQLFKFAALNPPTAISGLFDDFSHYGFLQKNSQNLNSHPDFYFDVICALYACGLEGELIDISKAFSNHQINEQQDCFLSMFHHFFTVKNLQEKITYLEKHTFTGLYENCRIYLAGITAYLMGNRKVAIKYLSQYLPKAESYIAEAYTIMIMAKNNPSMLSTQFKFGDKTQYAIEEILNFYQLKSPLRELALKLRADILRKKINYPNNYSPSGLLKLKNLIFNIRDKRKFSTIR